MDSTPPFSAYLTLRFTSYSPPKGGAPAAETIAAASSVSFRRSRMRKSSVRGTISPTAFLAIGETASCASRSFILLNSNTFSALSFIIHFRKFKFPVSSAYPVHFSAEDFPFEYRKSCFQVLCIFSSVHRHLQIPRIEMLLLSRDLLL